MNDRTELAEALKRSRDALGRTRPNADLKRRATEYARQELKRGESIGRLARALGINLMTLRHWLDESSTSRSAVVPVRVAVTETPRSRVVVSGPGGIRIDGMTLPDLAELIKRLA